MFRTLAMLIVVFLSACATIPQGTFHRVSDGMKVDDTPDNFDKFKVDRSICDGEAAQAALTSQAKWKFEHADNVNLVFQGCMAKRGYVLR